MLCKYYINSTRIARRKSLCSEKVAFMRSTQEVHVTYQIHIAKILEFSSSCLKPIIAVDRYI